MILSPPLSINQGRPSRGRRPPVFSLLGGGTPAGLAGQGVLFGNKGEAVSITRATNKLVQTSPNTVATVASGALAVDYRGLCVELGHTNLLLRSQEFDNASWVKGLAGTGLAPTVTANFATAPNGTATADRLQISSIAGGAGNASIVYQIYTSPGNVPVTFSVWIRGTNGPGTTRLFLYKNTVSNYFAGVTVNYTTEWQLFTVTGTITGTPTAVSVNIGSDGADSPDQGAADICVWQADLIASSYAKSPVVTTTATAACNADVVTLGSSVYDTLPVARGAVDCWVTPMWSTGNGVPATQFLDTRLNANVGGVALYYFNDALGFLTRREAVGISTLESSALTWTAGQTYRCHVEWGSGNVLIYRNNTLVASNLTGTLNMPNAHTAFTVGAAFTGAAQADAFISNLCFYTP